MTRARVFEGTTSLAGVWVDLLRANCLTLVERPGVVNAVSLSRAFPMGSESEREAFISLAQRLAEEYGLRAELERRGYFLTIRVTRAPEETAAATEESSGVSLVAKVRSVLRSRQKVQNESQPMTEPADSPAEVQS